MAPNYKTNDPKGYGGDPKRGAALGRASIRKADPATFDGALTLRRVRLDSGGYDENGTYFGSGEPLFWCASEDGNVDFMLRAPDRKAAIDKVRAKWYPLGTVKPYAANGGMRATILRSMTRIAWCMAWSDHVDEYGCTNLSGCEITECAPEVPSELEADAEKAILEIEARFAEHVSTASQSRAAVDWLRENSEPSEERNALLVQAEESPIVRALVLAARAQAEAEQSEESEPFEHPTDEAWSYLLESDEFAEEFGSCLAHALVGSGIAWSDDHAKIPMPDIYSATHLADAARDLADRTCEECALPPEIEKTRDEKTGALPAFSSVGGYTLIYTTKQGNVLCSECAGQLRAHDDKVVDVGTYDEGSDLYCEECNEAIESSYGDPEEEDRIRKAFEVSDHYRTAEKYQIDREDKAWSVTELGTGRAWSVHHASGGDAIDGLCFEVVAEGEEG